jgi:hypothetical protein
MKGITDRDLLVSQYYKIYSSYFRSLSLSLKYYFRRRLWSNTIHYANIPGFRPNYALQDRFKGKPNPSTTAVELDYFQDRWELARRRIQPKLYIVRQAVAEYRRQQKPDTAA